MVSTLQCYVGICCHAAGDLEDARLYVHKALASATENEELYFKGRAIIWEGRLMGNLSGNNSTEAIQRIKEGLEILTELDTRPDISIGHLYLGELYAEMNQDKEAQTHLKKAEALFKEMSMDYWSAETGKIMTRHPIGNP